MNERTLVVEQEPILDAILVSPGSLMVTLYGRPGHRYLLQSATALDGSEVWQNEGTVELNGAREAIERPITATPRFYRFVEQ
jgi:hypothetical protein